MWLDREIEGKMDRKVVGNLLLPPQLMEQGGGRDSRGERPHCTQGEVMVRKIVEQKILKET